MYRLLFFIAFLPGILLAQHDHAQCGVVDQSTLVKRLRANRAAYRADILQKSKDSHNIPIKFHLVGTNDGGGRIDFSDVLEEMCFSNQIFNSFDMNLFIADGVSLVDNDSLYFYSGMYSDTMSFRISEVKRIKSESGPNHVNVFITNEAGAPNVAGFNNPFVDFVVVQKDFMGTGESTFSHELGHFFSIQHPHLGWEGEAYDRSIHGDTVRIDTIGNGYLVEHMNKDNCEVAGDNICDTPPDYNFGARWTSDCRPFTRRVWDANHDLIETSQRNIMSYFFGCSDIFFSPGQVEAIQLDLASPERDFLKTDYVPIQEKITEELTMITPAFNQVMDYYNAVLLEWSPVEYATDYYISIAGGGQELIYFSSDTTFLVEDLRPRSTYRITMHPFNESGGCATSVSTLFKTSDAVTSIIDPSFIRNVSVFPNPILGGDKLVVELNSTLSLDATFRILTMEGRTVHSVTTPIINGKNNVTVGTKGLAKGIYMIQMDTNKGSIVRKIIVQ